MTKWDAFKAALAGGGWAGVVNTLIGLGVTIGLLSAAQSSALATLIAGLATFLNLLVATIHTVQASKALRVNAELRRMAVSLHTMHGTADNPSQYD